MKLLDYIYTRIDNNWILYPLIAIAGLLVFLLIIAIVMILWNRLMPELFNLPIITYWQSAGLLLLCSALFKSAPSFK